MTNFDTQRAYDLRCEAEAIAQQDDLVTVQLSKPVAWVVRDLLGLTELIPAVRVKPDMLRLNAVLGIRDDDGPHVSGWSKKFVRRLQKR